MAWTDDIQPLYGTVEGKFAGVSYDSADADLVPDVQPLEGTVTFTPTVAAGRIDDALVQILTTSRSIFGGQIVDDEQTPGVRLMSTDQPLGIEDWAWKATFHLDSGLRLKPLTFKLPAGETVSITDGIVPIESAPFQIVEGKEGATAYEVAVHAGFIGTEAQWLASLKGSKGDAGDQWTRRTIAASEDVLTLPPGVYQLTASAVWTAVNIPERVVGIVVVEGLPSTADMSVRHLPRGKGYFWENRKSGTSTWQGWGKVATVDRGARGIIPNGTDIDSMRGVSWAGTWDTPGAGGPNLATLTGTFPPILSGGGPVQGQIEVGGQLGNLGDLGFQRISVVATSYYGVQVWHRANKGYNTTGPEAWTDWVRLDAPDLTSRVEALEAAGGGSSGPPVNALATGSRDMRLQLFRDAYPLKSTGGKGCVVFRYDHGLTNFKSTLLPLHQQYGIVPYVAMNSRNWGLAENSGATQAEAKTWNVEWGNHTSDHNDKTGIQDVWDTIVNGRIELEQQLGRTVHGFTVPGLPGADGNSYSKLDGFAEGYAAGYSNSYAGSLILAHHAICSGVIGPQHRIIPRVNDGSIPIGMRHYGWESRAWEGTDGIKALIDQAVSTKTALTLMQHPRTMNAAGYWTPALAEQVISYVRQLIDTGDLANVSYMQSHRVQLDPL